MNVVDYNEIYKAKFDEYLPLYLFLGMDEKKLLTQMEKAVKNGRKIDTKKILKGLPRKAII